MKFFDIFSNLKLNNLFLSFNHTYEILFSYSIFKNIEKRDFIYKVSDKNLCCIFCLTPYSLTEFDDKSHVIPYSLGNKFLMHREECKKCNKKFGDKIETDLASFTKIFRVLNGQENRSNKNPGYLKYASKSQKALIQSKITESGLLLEVTGERTQDILKEYNENSISIESEDTYIDSNVYKALMKAIYGVLPANYRKDFSKLRKWINTDDPHVKFVTHLLVHLTILPTMHPNNLIFDVYRKKRSIKNLIFNRKYFDYFAIISFGNVLLDIPLISDKTIGNGKGLRIPLLSKIAVSEKGANQFILDMSNTDKSSKKLSLPFSGDCRIQR